MSKELSSVDSFSKSYISAPGTAPDLGVAPIDRARAVTPLPVPYALYPILAPNTRPLEGVQLADFFLIFWRETAVPPSLTSYYRATIR